MLIKVPNVPRVAALASVCYLMGHRPGQGDTSPRPSIIEHLREAVTGVTEHGQEPSVSRHDS